MSDLDQQVHLSESSVPQFELKIAFSAKPAEAKALYEALLLVAGAWSKHKRIQNPDCELVNVSAPSQSTP